MFLQILRKRDAKNKVTDSFLIFNSLTSSIK